MRVSTEQQDYNKQLDLCKKHAQIKGYEVYKVYSDVVSGKETSRKEFTQLLEDMRG